MTAPQPPWATAYGPGVPLHLDYDDSTLVDRLERSVRVQPGRVATAVRPFVVPGCNARQSAQSR